MKFECSNDFEQMPISRLGKFCTDCQKEIIDFTAYSRKDIIQYYQKHPRVCGRFNIEQIDSTLIPLENFIPKKTWLLLLFASLLGVANSKAKSFQPNINIEQPLSPIINSTDSIIQKPKSKMDVAKEGNLAEHKFPTTVSKTKYYLSLRFPFIHKRKTTHWIGCPRF